MVKETQDNLPIGWAKVKIGEIVSFEYGKGLRSDIRDKFGSIPVFGSNGVVGFHSEPLINNDCLIIGRKGAVGTIHLSSGPCWPIDTTYYIIPPDGIELSFLSAVLSMDKPTDMGISTTADGKPIDPAEWAEKVDSQGSSRRRPQSGKGRLRIKSCDAQGQLSMLALSEEPGLDQLLSNSRPVYMKFRTSSQLAKRW